MSLTGTTDNTKNYYSQVTFNTSGTITAGDWWGFTITKTDGSTEEYKVQAANGTESQLFTDLIAKLPASYTHATTGGFLTVTDSLGHIQSVESLTVTAPILVQWHSSPSLSPFFV